MYAIETSKMSSKGQLVVPDLFRKRYGWTAGMTLLLIGTADSVVVQALNVPDEPSVAATIRESRAAASDVAARLRKARRSVDAIARLGISLPVDAEKGEGRRRTLVEKYA